MREYEWQVSAPEVAAKPRRADAAQNSRPEQGAAHERQHTKGLFSQSQAQRLSQVHTSQLCGRSSTVNGSYSHHNKLQTFTAELRSTQALGLHSATCTATIRHSKLHRLWLRGHLE